MIVTIADDHGNVTRELRRAGPVRGWVARAIQRIIEAADVLDAAITANQPAKVLLNVRGDSVKAEITQYLGE